MSVQAQRAGVEALATFNFALFAPAYRFVSAKSWFQGPKVQGTPQELAKIEAELEAAGQPAAVAGATR